jgi:hypothetical protein
MANVTVKSAFVEDVIGSPAFALKLTEPHSKKDDSGKWQTVSRTFFDLKVSRESGIDLGQFSKGDRVTFSGSQKTEVREYEGKKFYTLTVWADNVAHIDGATPNPVKAVEDTFYAQTEPAPAFIDDGAPF